MGLGDFLSGWFGSSSQFITPPDVAPRAFREAMEVIGGSTPSVQGGTSVYPRSVEPIPIVDEPIKDLPSTPENLQDAAGRRVRLRAKPGARSISPASENDTGYGRAPGGSLIYGIGGIMAPLITTDGMVFPYQPTITWQQDVQYTEMELIHTNQDIQAYKRTPSPKFSIDGEFTVQNQAEGKYALACIHFLRTVTKMHFGDSDPNRGTPPPVLLFDAYGAYMFNSLPVIVTQFSVSLPKDVDYVPVDVNSNTSGLNSLNQTGQWNKLTESYFPATGSNSNIAWLPALFNIQVQLTVQNTPARLRAFKLEDFRSGALLQKGGWI